MIEGDTGIVLSFGYELGKCRGAIQVSFFFLSMNFANVEERYRYRSFLCMFAFSGSNYEKGMRDGDTGIVFFIVCELEAWLTPIPVSFLLLTRVISCLVDDFPDDSLLYCSSSQFRSESASRWSGMTLMKLPRKRFLLPTSLRHSSTLFKGQLTSIIVRQICLRWISKHLIIFGQMETETRLTILSLLGTFGCWTRF